MKHLNIGGGLLTVFSLKSIGRLILSESITIINPNLSRLKVPKNWKTNTLFDFFLT